MRFHPGFLWVSLTLTLTCATPAAFPAPPKLPSSYTEAVAALEDVAPERRAEAIAWIANHGRMADQPLLVRRLRDSDGFVREVAEQALWRLWSRSGEPAVDRLMAEGAELMQAGRLDEAIGVYSEVIRRKPAFAEGWNKRATALYLSGDYQRSLADCAEVIKRNPRHFGALSGAGLVSLELEQERQALEWFRRALEVNPNMGAIEAEARRLEELLRGRST
jgi:tetratricopeptide (TPR) repeat protein